jgi:hypothetical protein
MRKSAMIACGLLWACVAVPGLCATFTGSYFRDGRPGEIDYLTLTQAGAKVVGSITGVSVKNLQLQSFTIPLSGTADGDSVSLAAKDRDLIINGRKEGDLVVLTFPTPTGPLVRLTLHPSDISKFNAAVADWGRVLTVERTKVQQKQEGDKRLTSLAVELQTRLDAMKYTGIPNGVQQVEGALAQEAAALHALQAHLADTKRDASVRPLTCHQSGLVTHDYRAVMGHDANSWLVHAIKQFKSSKHALNARLAHSDIGIAEASETGTALKQAIALAAPPLPQLAATPDEVGPAIARYRKIATTARDALPHMEAAHEANIQKAKELMSQGEAVLEDTRSQVRCRSER